MNSILIHHSTKDILPHKKGHYYVMDEGSEIPSTCYFNGEEFITGLRDVVVWYEEVERVEFTPEELEEFKKSIQTQTLNTIMDEFGTFLKMMLNGIKNK